MHKKSLINYTYKEIFIISSDVNDSEEHLPVEIYTEFFDVVEALSTKNAKKNKNVKVVHGHLLPASIIPNCFGGTTPFIIVDLPEINYGMFIKDFSIIPEDLAVNIETLISYGLDFAPKEINIKNVFILYGTEITVTLSITEDELDEELIEKSSLIVNEINKVETELKKREMICNESHNKDRTLY